METRNRTEFKILHLDILCRMAKSGYMLVTSPACKHGSTTDRQMDGRTSHSTCRASITSRGKITIAGKRRWHLDCWRSDCRPSGTQCAVRYCTDGQHPSTRDHNQVRLDALLCVELTELLKSQTEPGLRKCLSWKIQIINELSNCGKCDTLFIQVDTIHRYLRFFFAFFSSFRLLQQFFPAVSITDMARPFNAVQSCI